MPTVKLAPRRQVLAAFFAPGLLFSVALLQVYLVKHYDLSPWKGGGFGMFSTVDAPSARFLRLYLLTNDEEIPISIPVDLSHKALTYRTFPLQENGQELANELAKKRWQYVHVKSATNHYQSLLKAQESTPSSDSNKLNQPENSTSEFDFRPFKFVEPMDSSQTENPENLPINIERLVEHHSVRLELWRYYFNKPELELISTKVQSFVSVPFYQ